MILKRLTVVAVLLGVMLVGLARPASAIFDKVRFATDLGVAYFCFHHWVMKPYKEGEFSAGAPHRTKAIIKGGAAMLFAVNRLKAADAICHSTKSPTLQKLGGMIDSITTSFGLMGHRLKSGEFHPDDAAGLERSLGSLSSGASAQGISIKDVPVTVPGM